MTKIVTTMCLLLSVTSAHAEDKMLKAKVKMTSEASVADASVGGQETASSSVTPAVTPESALVAHVCVNGSNTRRVELAGTSPCTVHYKKETEKPGHDEVLYTAKNDQKYCEIKAQAFVEKLTGMGWKCNKA